MAIFDVTPGYGTIDTLFTYDASEVSDLEDPVDVLQVRWDWESDSVFDTDFSTEKVVTHQFEEGGTFYTTVEVKDADGATDRYTDFVRVGWNNRPPNASFSISPESGFMQDVFTFDASSCSDAEDNNADLLVRWDFEGDGNWDTEFSIEKVTTHQFETAGTYEVTLEVQDSEEATDLATLSLTVGETNQPPTMPSDPTPSDGAVDFSTACTLTWNSIDPEGGELTFDIYFGDGLDQHSESPPLVATGVEANSYICIPLEYETTYYWKIVAKDTYDHVVSGPVWSFTTDSPVNEMGSFTDIRNGKVYKTVQIGEQIWMAENLNIGTMIHSSNGGDYNDGYQKDNSRAEKYCYNNDPANCELYGGLYQWDEAMAYSESEKATGLCPVGWHLPTKSEWRELVLYYEDQGLIAGNELRLGSRSGFQAVFSGYLIFAERRFYDLKQGGYFWSSTLNPDINHLALGRSLFYGNTVFQEDTFQRVSGLPVRCIKDY